MLDVKILDPYENTNYGTRNHGHMIYDTLFSWDSKLQPHPQMVDTYNVSPDQLTWTFKLRPGLAFSDGQPVTPNDVIASLTKFLAKDGFGQKLKADLVAMEARGADGFDLVLKHPFPLVPMVPGKAVRVRRLHRTGAHRATAGRLAAIPADRIRPLHLPA